MIFGRGRKFLAVDAGSGRLKVLLARACRRRLEVHSYICWPAPAPGSGGFWGSGELASILARAVDELGAEGCRALATLGAGDVFLKVFACRLLPGQKLTGPILREAAGLLPFPAEEAVLRYRVLGKAKSSSGGEREVLVLLAAASAGTVRRCYETFLAAGLTLKALDLQHFSLWRAVFGGRRVKNGAAVHIGRQSTLFLVVREGGIIFAHTVPAGGDLVAKAVAGAGGVSEEAAWELIGRLGKRELPDAGRTFPQKSAVSVELSLKEGISVLLGEISRAVEAYNSVHGTFCPEKVVLSGGACELDGIGEWLKTAWEVPVEVFYPASLDGQGGEITLDPSFAVAAGTALREVI